MTTRSRDRLGLAVLAALAYLPALASSPGRMPADTKLYLYLDPGGLVGRSTSTFEPDLFAGWVPHQQITYLWPSGPWFWFFEWIGAPDWVAHRLWIGTVLFAAGAGVRWVARQLGIGPVAAVGAAALYQLSPYLLAYISRTSLLLLPWAGLGWIIGLTIRATRAEPVADRGWRRRVAGWREPAAIALIVATVGSVNATALALIVPGPVLWLLHAAGLGTITWRRAIGIGLRTGALCLLISAWWVAMLVVQSRHGAPVLAYSETLRDVSRNSTGSEVLRSLGYWLFYQRDPAGPTTTASLDYLVSGRAIALSFGVTLVGLAGMVLVRWRHRRFAAWLVAVGAVLAVGVHPIDDSSPLMRLLAGDETSSLGLALRSSTRATPLIVLGLALGAGAIVASLPARVPGLPARASPPWRAVGATALVLLVVANLPALWRFDLVDPAIDRDQDPPAPWIEAAGAIDARPPDVAGGARLLQLPGAEFGAFRWGYTVDHPLVSLVDRPVVTRDLLPLGSGPAMDLLYAVDDRIQEGWLEPETIAPLARLLAADLIWLSNDAAFERFRTARPEILADLLAGDRPVDGLERLDSYGRAVVNTGEVPTLDERALADARVGAALPPVDVLEVADPLGIVRTAVDSQVLSGSGDGIIDAAAAGLLERDAVIRYSLSHSGPELAAVIAEAGGLLVTDTNRDRARHWRGSQDVHGHTEPGGVDVDVLDPTAADQRLAPFADTTSDQQTVALQIGPVRAIASSYGEPFAYRPEDRAVMAIDGDPTTAWLVGDHGDPTGERLRLSVAEAASPPDEPVRLRQPAPAPGGRVIERIAIAVIDDASGEERGAPLTVQLDERSWSPDGQPVTVPGVAAGTSVEITIEEVTTGDVTVAASRAGVGFVEVDLGLGATVEYVRPPVDGLAEVGSEPVALVLTRLRVDPLDAWRADPEPELQRTIPLPRDLDGDLDVTIRIDARATDDTLARLFAEDASARPARTAVPVANRRLTGSVPHRGAAATDGDDATAWITPFDAAVGSALRFDRVEPLRGFDLVQPTGEFSTITELRLTDATGEVTVDVPPPDRSGRSRISLDGASVGDGPLTIEISGVEPVTTIDRRYGDLRTLPAAIAEIDSDAIGVRPLAARDQPVGWSCISAPLLEIDGRATPIEFTSTVGTLVDGGAVRAAPCDPSALGAGTTTVRSIGRRAHGLTVDRLTYAEPGDVASAEVPPSLEILDDDARRRAVRVGPCPTGCWLVLGEGFNDAWEASIDGDALDGPELVDGGFNGWFLPPSDTARVVVVRWTAQWPVTVGLTISLLATVAALILVIATRTRPRALSERRPVFRSGPARNGVLAPGGLLVVVAAIAISPSWGLVAAVAVALAALLAPRVRRPFETIGWIAAAVVAVQTYWIERRDAPFPDAGWTEHVATLNGLALFAVMAIAAGATFDTETDSRCSTRRSRP